MTTASKTTTKSTLIDRIHERVGGTKREIADTVDGIFEVMKEELENGGVLKISGFGRFDILEKAERVGRNPKTKEEIMISKRKVVRFKISKVFKDELNKDS